MRIKLTLAIVVGLLICALVDNTSNDFSLVVFANDAVTVVEIQMLPQALPVLADIQRRQADACFPTHSLTQSFRTSDDFLHASCVTRTTAKPTRSLTDS